MKRIVSVTISICVVGIIGGILIAAGGSGRRDSRIVKRPPGFLLGDLTVEAHQDVVPVGRSVAFRVRATESGSARWISLYVERRSFVQTIRVALYRNAGNGPGVLLTAGAQRRSVPGTWNHFQLSPVSIVRGQTYWLAVLNPGGVMTYRDRTSGTCVSEEMGRAALVGFPSRWTPGGVGHRCPLSAIVTSTLSLTRPSPSAPVGATPTGTQPASVTQTVPASSTTSTGTVGSQKNCSSAPGICGYPDTTNAGVPAGTALTPVGQAALPAGATWDAANQDLAIRGSNITINGLEVPGSIDIYGNDVTIDNTQVDDDAGDQAIFSHDPATGTVIENTTIQPMSADAPISDGILGNGVTVRRSYIHGTVEDVNGGALTVEDSYLISDGKETGGHNEAIDLADGTAQPTLIEHNTLFNPEGQTAAIIAGGTYGPLENVTIDGNLMAGGGYTLYCCETDAWQVTTAPTNTAITNNRWSRKYNSDGGGYGPIADLDTKFTTFTGNVWDDTLKPVTP